MSDPYDLQRFVDAQNPVYRRVVEELGRGRKATHWMWFVFPQIAGLSFSAMVQRFAISSRAEAAAYLQHDVLGPRLVECTRLIVAASDKSIADILGSPDDMKFRSSMTAVRRRLEAADLQRRYRGLLSGRQRSGDRVDSLAKRSSLTVVLWELRTARHVLRRAAECGPPPELASFPQSGRSVHCQ